MDSTLHSMTEKHDGCFPSQNKGGKGHASGQSSMLRREHSGFPASKRGLEVSHD